MNQASCGLWQRGKHMSSVVIRRKQLLGVAIAFALVVTAAIAVSARPAEAAYPGGNGWILFERGADIWAVPADGSAAPTNLTGGFGPWNETDPSVSPDGTQVAFSSAYGLSSASNIWVADFNPAGPSLEGYGTATHVTTGTFDRDGEPSWSPDGLSLVFQRRGIVVATGTATADDGTGATLTDATATFQTDGVTAGMLVENLTTGDSGTVASPPASETDLSVTPAVSLTWTTGDAYRVSVDSSRRIYKVVIGGAETALSPVTAIAYDERNPAWSPTGARIAFETTANGNADVYTMNTAGADRVNLTGSAQFDDNAFRPAWSPDGLRIAFHSNEPDTTHANVWTVNSSTGAGAVNVTGAKTGTDDDRDAAYSPDGTRIVFTRQAALATSRSLATINVDGSGVVSGVTTPAGTNLDNEPNWQPILTGVADGYTINEGSLLQPAAPALLSNDGLFAAALGAATAVKVSDPAHGTVTVNSNGSFSYQHDGSETVADSFTYRPVQAGIQGSVATVSITVTPVNDAPKAVNDGPYNVEIPGGSVAVPAPGVLANDTDAEGGGLTALLKTDASNGTVTLNPDGSFTYTHDGSDTTTDSFTYQAKDGAGALSNIATVSLTVGADPVHLTGLVDPSQGLWHLYDELGVQTSQFFFGNPGDYPIMGDWDCDGIETPGMYRQSDGYVYLRNTNTQGPGDIKFFFGNPGDVPIAGDFNGDGCGTVSIYRPSSQTFYIINTLGENDGGLGAAEFSYVFGDPGDKPFVGDFDGDGVETVGLHRESTGLVYFRNSHSQGNADSQFIFGDPGDRLIAGDWNANGVFTPALFRPSSSTMFFRYTNTQGNADNQFVPSPVGSTWLPVSGVTN